MKFIESRLCQEHQYCTICRHKEAGREWRTLAARIYEMDMLDFVCPYGIAWLEANQVVLADQFKVIPKVVLPMDNRQLGEMIAALDGELRQRLPETSAIIKGLNAYAFESRHAGGCQGCRRKRVMGQLGQSVREALIEEQAAVSQLINPA
jgi:hypothetical protein